MIRVFPRAQDVLAASIVGELVQHPAATFHLDGVAATEERAQVSAVSAALKASTLEVLVLEKYNLDKKATEETEVNSQSSKNNKSLLP